ncbi:prephenate dehydratase [Anaeroselena agilis]|uniref:prephenate dehydratase n=1 Tax=Anaeroselena agilis TaxID=3063788 RepID=A0ABU3NWK5_9FIRM|nr:prephenate dehydratase [Selenomonadales bacterium 4137-cl]
MNRRLSLSIVFLLVLAFAFTGTAGAAVSYLGPAGTYTEEAAFLHFGQQETLVPAATVAESLAMLDRRECDYAVVPVENTIGGPVYRYIDLVVANKGLRVVGELNLPIRQTLLALPGAALSGVKTVMSHPQGIAQSREWLKKNLPDAKLVEVSSTAEAARKVAEMGDPSVAAIAASRTAAVYNLSILANDLQYTNTNVTRFWVVTLKKQAAPAKAKAAVVVSGPADKVPGLLYDLGRKGFKLTALHDRPAKTRLGEYVFVAEAAGGSADALEEVVAKHGGALEIRVLGLYETKSF